MSRDTQRLIKLSKEFAQQHQQFCALREKYGQLIHDFIAIEYTLAYNNDLKQIRLARYKRAPTPVSLPQWGGILTVLRMLTPYWQSSVSSSEFTKPDVCHLLLPTISYY